MCVHAGHFSKWDFMCSSFAWPFSFSSHPSSFVFPTNTSRLLLSRCLWALFTLSPKQREVVPSLKGSVSWNPLLWTWLSIDLCNPSQPLYARMTSPRVKLSVVNFQMFPRARKFYNCQWLSCFLSFCHWSPRFQTYFVSFSFYCFLLYLLPGTTYYTFSLAYIHVLSTF